jgi:hypothetical protein
MAITEKNHYVPRLYLKNFTGTNGYLHRYRTLVSRDDIAPWKPLRPGGVAYQSHLYTSFAGGDESDEIERWLCKEFEDPAEEPIFKAINGLKLTKLDYTALTRFAVAQSVRTPAFFVRNRPRWISEAEKQNKISLNRIKAKLEAGEKPREAEQNLPADVRKYYPLRVSRVPSDKEGMGALKVESVVGRGTWHFAMKHLLTSTVERLTFHKWTIIHPPDEMEWFTSDDPVVLLNFRSVLDYGFEGGWGVPHTNIILPLSPQHLLFTQVGDRGPLRGSSLDEGTSQFLRKIIAEHAFRYIFARKPLKDVEVMRRRIVDPGEVQHESQEWQRWHHEQSGFERDFAVDPSDIERARREALS